MTNLTFTPGEGLTLGEIVLPQGPTKTDEFFGTQMVYENNTVFTIPVKTHAAQNKITVGYRGCAPVGVCYPPIEEHLYLDFNQASPQSEHSQATQILVDQHFIIALIIFFGLGLLLAFTPCVLPMLPILFGIILGQKNLSRARTFELSLIYVLAVALTFALAGVGAALLGASLQSSLQQPWVLISSAAILVILAILLFIDYPMQLPQGLNNTLNTLSRRQKGGTVIGVASMGILSALVVSPCVTPPLIGALIYIAETGNVSLGAGALFMLGLGMGVPLILLSVFGMHLLPKKGPWLSSIKIIFAALLVALAATLVMRALPNMDLQGSTQATPTFDSIPVTSIINVESELKQARKHNQFALLYFSADWCVSCARMEKTVFPDPTVQTLLKNIRVLKADVTANNLNDKALLQYFNVYGPPAIVFFAFDGTPQAEFQLHGEINAANFATHLERWFYDQSHEKPL